MPRSKQLAEEFRIALEPLDQHESPSVLASVGHILSRALTAIRAVCDYVENTPEDLRELAYEARQEVIRAGEAYAEAYKAEQYGPEADQLRREYSAAKRKHERYAKLISNPKDND